VASPFVVRDRWLARINAPSWATFDASDPIPPSLLYRRVMFTVDDTDATLDGLAMILTTHLDTPR
jgi:hypothetical protein